MTRLSCKCQTCKTSGASAVLVPDSFAPGMDRKKLAHGLVWQSNHPTTGSAFRTQTGIELAR